MGSFLSENPQLNDYSFYFNYIGNSHWQINSYFLGVFEERSVGVLSLGVLSLSVLSLGVHSLGVRSFGETAATGVRGLGARSFGVQPLRVRSLGERSIGERSMGDRFLVRRSFGDNLSILISETTKNNLEKSAVSFSAFNRLMCDWSSLIL